MPTIDDEAPCSQATQTPFDLANKIIDVVLAFTGVRHSAFLGANRTNYVSKVRDTVMYLIRAHTDLSHVQIAEILQRKSHLISLSACRREAMRVERGVLKKIGTESVTYAEWHKRVMAAVRDGRLQ